MTVGAVVVIGGAVTAGILSGAALVFLFCVENFHVFGAIDDHGSPHDEVRRRDIRCSLPRRGLIHACAQEACPGKRRRVGDILRGLTYRNQ